MYFYFIVMFLNLLIASKVDLKDTLQNFALFSRRFFFLSNTFNFFSAAEYGISTLNFLLVPRNLQFLDSFNER